jgi:uncharacterized protein YjbI with pentapeptide repeats
MGMTQSNPNEIRQQQLLQMLAVMPDIAQGRYPFRNVRLSRSDVEWLLAQHDDGRGPVDWQDETQRSRLGLDLRGANLHDEDLRGLPLARTRFGLTREEWAAHHQLGVETLSLAGANLLGVNLGYTHLEGAAFSKAIMTSIDLDGSFLQHASLIGALLDGQAKLRRAHLEKATLGMADLQGAWLLYADLTDAILQEAVLDGANLVGVRAPGVFADGAHFKRAHLFNSNLCGASLERADMDSALLMDVDLTQAILKDTQLQCADLSRAVLVGAKMMKANLTGATLRRVIFGDDTQLDEVILTDQVPRNFLTPVSQFVRRFVRHKEQSPLKGSVRLADAVYRNVNLAVLDLASLWELGDEHAARTQKATSRETVRKWREMTWRHIQDRMALADVAHEGYLELRAREQAKVLEQYELAVRACRQFATALKTQGMDEEAAYFSYRAQVLQRGVFRRRIALGHLASLGGLLFSWLLWAISGYGYRIWHSVITYVVVVGFFAALYHVYTGVPGVEAWFTSMNAFHGRGFQPDLYKNNEPGTIIGGVEALVGLILEATFIATLIQRFFGK